MLLPLRCHAGDVLTPREPLTGSFCHSGHWLRFQWSLWEFLAMALLC